MRNVIVHCVALIVCGCLVGCGSAHVKSKKLSVIVYMGHFGDDSTYAFAIKRDGTAFVALSQDVDDSHCTLEWLEIPDSSRREFEQISENARVLTSQGGELASVPHSKDDMLMTVGGDGRVAVKSWDGIVSPFWGVVVTSRRKDVSSLIQTWYAMKYDVCYLCSLADDRRVFETIDLPELMQARVEDFMRCKPVARP